MEIRNCSMPVEDNTWSQIMNPGLKNAIRVAAKKDRRSMAAFIEIAMAKAIKYDLDQGD